MANMARVAEAIAAQQQEDEDLEFDANSRSKPRWRMSSECKDALERAYLVDKCPSLATREALAANYDITARQVQVWFQNKRQRTQKRMASEAFDDAPQSHKRAAAAPSPGEESLSVGRTPTQHTTCQNGGALDRGVQPKGNSANGPVLATSRDDAGMPLPLQIASVPSHCTLSQLVQPTFAPPSSFDTNSTSETQPFVPPTAATPRRVGSVDSLADLAFVASRVEEMSESLSRVGSLAELSSLSRVGSLADFASFSRAGSLVDLASFARSYEASHA